MRRFFKAIFAGGAALAILLSFSLGASAIGFDAEKAYDSVFVLQSGDTLGSGFAYGSNAVITNAHVVSDRTQIYVTDYDGNTREAFLAAIDEELDLAVVGITGASYTPIRPSNLAKLSSGDDVYAIGAPNSMAYTLTKGVISSKERAAGDMVYIQTDAAINHGNSGGPLLDDTGCVVGVNSLKMSDSEGIGLAIPIDTVRSFLTESGISLAEDGTIEGELTPLEQPQESDSPKQPAGDGGDEAPERSGAPVSIVLWCALGLSVLLNIVLIVILVFQKKKNVNVKYDPKERTDFDIDILE